VQSGLLPSWKPAAIKANPHPDASVSLRENDHLLFGDRFVNCRRAWPGTGGNRLRPRFSSGGQRHDATISPLDPDALEPSATERGAQLASQMRPALGPVETGIEQAPPASPERVEIDAECQEDIPRGGPEPNKISARMDECFGVSQGDKERDAKTTS
jgi:hypothetical protein